MGASEAWSSAPAWFVIVVVGLAAVVSSSEAYVFYAGGRDGWVLDPTESYNHWAGRSRFQVNDTIVFTHEADSVLLVTEQDFDTCNTRSPVRRLQAQAAVGSGGGSVSIRLDRSGPFFFISSDEDRCRKGQKLYIIVMAVRRRPTTTPAPADSVFPPAPAVEPAPPADSVFPPAPAVVEPPAPNSAFPPAPSPAWASAPENAHAPPPTAGASRLVDGAIIGSAVVGVIGALVVLCAV